MSKLKPDLDDPYRFTGADYRRRKWRGKYMSESQTRFVLLLTARSYRYTNIQDMVLFMWPHPDDEPDYAIGVIRYYIAKSRTKFDIIIDSDQNGSYRLRR